jgi:hypothetical protein
MAVRVGAPQAALLLELSPLAALEELEEEDPAEKLAASFWAASGVGAIRLRGIVPITTVPVLSTTWAQIVPKIGL